MKDDEDRGKLERTTKKKNDTSKELLHVAVCALENQTSETPRREKGAEERQKPSTLKNEVNPLLT